MTGECFGAGRRAPDFDFELWAAVARPSSLGRHCDGAARTVSSRRRTGRRAASRASRSSLVPGSESIGWLACEDLEAERAPVLEVSMAEDWSAGLLLLANGRLGAGARARASSLLDLGRHPARLYAALYRLLFHRAADDSLVAAEVRLAGPLEAHADRMLSEYAGLLPDYAHISDVIFDLRVQCDGYEI